MRDSIAQVRIRPKPLHPYQWLWEPLARDPGFELRRMFGGQSVYIDGRLVLFFAAKEEPWRGVFVCTERDHHASLRKDFPDVVPHPVLPKWLYLSEGTPTFERVATRLVAQAARRDPRFGIVSSPKKNKRPRPHGLDGHP